MLLSNNKLANIAAQAAVKILFLLRSQSLPTELVSLFKKTPASHVPAFFANVSENYMDLGFCDEYLACAEEVSYRMCGYPRECLTVLRKLKACYVEPENIGLISGKVGDRVLPKDDVPRAPAIPFLELPEKVREHIYQHLLCPRTIDIGDWGLDVHPSGLLRRTEYDVYDSRKRCPRRTTYTARTANRTRLYLNIMLVNRQINSETAQILYGQNTFRFLGTGESSLSFFHDRANKLSVLRKVSMQFSCNPLAKFVGCYNATCSIPKAPNTSIAAWRRICNVLVHSSTGLEDFELMIDSSFWEEATWMSGAEEVFEKSQLCEPWGTLSQAGLNTQIDRDRNFLQHVARLGGINFRLRIAGVDGVKEKEAFRKELESLVQKKTFGRPYLAEDEVPRCTCRKRFLPESCIWDREGKMRRGPPVG